MEINKNILNKTYNYKIIVDEVELDKFIEFLPELGNNEAYYISLMGRSKYIKGTQYDGVIKSDRSKLKRAIATNKSLIKSKIKQMETAYGTYDNDYGETIPQEALALYITINPRNLKLASKNMNNSITDSLYEGSYLNPYTESLKAIQNSASKRRFLEFDFDVDKNEITLDNLMDEITEKTTLTKDFFVVVETRGGYHILVNTIKMKENRIRVNWNDPFREVWKKYSTDTDNGGDQMVPVPGSFQGSFVPRLFVFD